MPVEYERMMRLRVVYIDEVLLVNLLIDYITLRATALLLGRTVRTKHCLIASCIGAAYAAALLIVPAASMWLAAIPTAFVMVITVFGIGDDAIKNFVAFLFVAYMFGGATMAVGQHLKFRPDIESSGIGFRVIITVICVCFIILRIFMNSLFPKGALEKEICLKIFCGQKSADILAIRDTGNRLRDPATGRGVVVVSASAAELLFDPQIASIIVEAGQRTADDLFTELSNREERRRFGLISFNSVGEKGLLLTYRPDRIEVCGEECGSSLIAFSPNPIKIADKPNVCAIVN